MAGSSLGHVLQVVAEADVVDPFDVLDVELLLLLLLDHAPPLALVLVVEVSPMVCSGRVGFYQVYP